MGKIVAVQGSKYSNEDRRRAVIAYLTHGSDSKVEEITGIPNNTVNNWRNHSDWWDCLLEEVREETQDKISASMRRIVEEAQEQVLDRIRNGDEVVLQKGGEIHKVRKLMSGKDLMTTGAIAFDKDRVIQALPTTYSGSADSQKLAQLAEQFRQISMEKQANVIDVIPKSASNKGQSGKSREKHEEA